MTLNFFGHLAVAGCLLLLSAGCNDGSTSVGGTGGAAGTGGAGGTQAPAQIPGLWEGQANGFDVCFYISDDGLRLTPSPMCNVTGEAQPDEVSRSFDLSVELVGTYENGDPCSFDLSFTNDVVIDQATNSFRASETQSGTELAFSGEITGDSASGVARRDSEGSDLPSRMGGHEVDPVRRTRDPVLPRPFGLLSGDSGQPGLFRELQFRCPAM